MTDIAAKTGFHRFEGDEQSLRFAMLLERNHSRILGYLLALVQNFADAEDLYQQTAIVLWEKFDQYVDGTDFGKWATTIAHFTAMNFLRQRSRQRALFSEAALARICEVQSPLPQTDMSLTNS